MFSKEKSITYSQRDVPGMTKAVIPHLRRVCPYNFIFLTY